MIKDVKCEVQFIDNMVMKISSLRMLAQIISSKDLLLKYSKKNFFIIIHRLFPEQTYFSLGYDFLKDEIEGNNEISIWKRKDGV